MNWFPLMQIGLFRGWIFLAFYLIVFIITLKTCSTEVRKRLYDRSLWNKKTKIITAIGKIFSILNLIMICLGVLVVYDIEFYIGSIFYVLGLFFLVRSIINYRDAPLDKPITIGLYKYSRNPQMISIYIMFLGMVLVIGSWINLIFLGIAISCSHFAILGEEQSLIQQYGDSYLEYKKQVARYFLFI